MCFEKNKAEFSTVASIKQSGGRATGGGLDRGAKGVRSQRPAWGACGTIASGRTSRARVAELVDARGLGPRGFHKPWGFESPLSHTSQFQKGGF